MRSIIDDVKGMQLASTPMMREGWHVLQRRMWAL
jgi:hypothetical protein